MLMRVFCRAGQDSVATVTPTFSMYRHYAAVQGAQLIESTTSRDQGFAIDVEALLSACNDTTRLIFVCSPNNPTGNVIPRDDLIRLLESRRNKSAIVVDEAYIEFAQHPSIIALLDRFENLIVLRTLSKARAYAGARCGSVIAAAPVIQLLNTVQAPYALATPVVECVENVLQAECVEEAEVWTRTVIDERERLVGAFRELPFVRRIWPSSANFFLVEVQDVPALLEQSASDRILLRYFGGDLADCVRITVGSAAENDRLLQTFRKLQAS